MRSFSSFFRRGISSRIPTVNLAEIQSKECVDDLAFSFSTFGCCYVSKHGLNDDLVFSQMQQFFQLPTSVKEKIPIDKLNNGLTRGYIDIGGESGSERLEVKEAFSYGYDLKPTDMALNPLEGPNKWPDSKHGSFQSVFNEYYTDTITIALELVQGLGLALGQSNDYLSQHCSFGERISIMRMFHYFPYNHVPESVQPNVERIGSSPHSDWGFLTIINSPTGGLEILFKDQWFEVPPRNNTVLINAGDYLELISGGKFKSPVHRVVTGTEDRLSTVFFIIPITMLAFRLCLVNLRQHNTIIYLMAPLPTIPYSMLHLENLFNQNGKMFSDEKIWGSGWGNREPPVSFNRS